MQIASTVKFKNSPFPLRPDLHQISRSRSQDLGWRIQGSPVSWSTSGDLRTPLWRNPEATSRRHHVTRSCIDLTLDRSHCSHRRRQQSPPPIPSNNPQPSPTGARRCQLPKPVVIEAWLSKVQAEVSWSPTSFSSHSALRQSPER